MGLLKPLKTLISGEPGAPQPRPFTPDPYVSSPTYQGYMNRIDPLYVSALERYLTKKPGYDEATIGEMYRLPAEQSKRSETETLRRMNQGSAYGGNFRTGSRIAGRGRVLSNFGAGRAEMRRNTMINAANVALQDNLNQLGAGADFMNARIGYGLQNTGMANQYNAHLNNLAAQIWAGRIAQYNQNYDKGYDQLMDIISAIAGGAGGGGGGGMGV